MVLLRMCQFKILKLINLNLKLASFTYEQANQCPCIICDKINLKMKHGVYCQLPTITQVFVWV